MRNAANAITEAYRDMFEDVLKDLLEDLLPAIVREIVQSMPAPSAPAQPMMDCDRFIPIAIACEMISKSKNALDRYVLSGKLSPSRKLPGGGRGWMKSELDAFFANLEVKRPSVRGGA